VLEKPVVTQLVKKFPAFYTTEIFTAVSIQSCHWSLSWIRYIQFILSHPIPPRSILWDG